MNCLIINEKCGVGKKNKYSEPSAEKSTRRLAHYVRVLLQVGDSLNVQPGTNAHLKYIVEVMN